MEAPGFIPPELQAPMPVTVTGLKNFFPCFRECPGGERGARFVCVAALAFPGGGIKYSEGILEGCITEKPSGTHGFGYDPVFYYPGTGKTLAEMGDGKKCYQPSRQGLSAMAKIILSILGENP